MCIRDRAVPGRGDARPRRARRAVLGLPSAIALTTCRVSISLDGFVAGPNQSTDEPFGEGGSRLNEWQFETDRDGRGGDAEVIAEVNTGVGAFVMGRNMFGAAAGRGTRRGPAGGATSRRSTHRSSCSPATPAGR